MYLKTQKFFFSVLASRRHISNENTTFKNATRGHMKTRLFENNDAIVFEKLLFQVSTRIHENEVFKISTLESVFKKLHFQRVTYSSDTCGREAKSKKKK